MHIAPPNPTGNAPAARARIGTLGKTVRGSAAAMVLALSCWVATTGAANAQLPSIGGDLTPYLVGGFDFIRPLADNSVSGMENRFTVHNPTTSSFSVALAPFDFSGNAADMGGVTCVTAPVAPNGSFFFAVAVDLGFPTTSFGTVKIVALTNLGLFGRPVAGIVGSQERFMYTGVAPLGAKDVVAGPRSNLASVPVEALNSRELNKIKAACGIAVLGPPGDIITRAQPESDDPRVRIRTSGDVTIHRAR